MDLSIYENEISLAIVQNAAGEVLIVQRVKGKNDRNEPILSWNFPGGIVRDNEHFIDTAKRRTYEETGYLINSHKEIASRPNSEQTKMIHYCRGVLISDEQDQIINDDIAEILWVPKFKIKNFFGDNIDSVIKDYLELD